MWIDFLADFVFITGKRKGKTLTQVKTLFRCAFNSKKGELRKLKVDKANGRIYWQFVGKF